jgi:gliding motility associated protien GldN
MFKNVLLAACLFAATSNLLFAQAYNESGATFAHNERQPRDNFYDRNLHLENEPLAYAHVEERDVAWSKRIWREIDLREKMNQYFNYTRKPLISILLEEAQKGNLILYSTTNDEFSQEINVEEVLNLCQTLDTVEVYNPETDQVEIAVVRNDFNPNDVLRYRIKEDWFFDRQTSRLGVRILGIAPIIHIKDENGNVLGQMPLFWIYYPHARQPLAKYEAFNPHNDGQRMSWEDMFEIRYFASYIIKESNVFDRYIQQYKQGNAALYEAEKIKDGIFNFEQDLWEY